MLRPLVATFLLTSPAWAEPPKVVTDILPVQGIVAGVMGDLGEPGRLVEPGVSPHHATLRPSQASLLQEADIVVRIGDSLIPWVGSSVKSIAPKAQDIVLLDVSGTILVEVRESPVFDLHDHSDRDGHDDHAGHDDHKDHDEHDDHASHDDHDDHNGHDDHAGHKDHDDHAGHKDHDDHAGHDDHEDHAAHDDHGHDHEAGSVDPHAWLDPENAIIWTTAIAEILATEDPGNAETYRANAKTAIAAIEAARDAVTDDLAAYRDQPVVFFHDAYQYFEARFDLYSIGAILSQEAEAASAARMKTLRDAIAQSDVICLFREPQMPDRAVQSLRDDLGARLATIDPLGADVAPGPDAYPAHIRKMGQAIKDCLSQAS